MYYFYIELSKKDNYLLYKHNNQITYAKKLEKSENADRGTPKFNMFQNIFSFESKHRFS